MQAVNAKQSTWSNLLRIRSYNNNNNNQAGYSCMYTLNIHELTLCQSGSIFIKYSHTYIFSQTKLHCFQKISLQAMSFWQDDKCVK